MRFVRKTRELEAGYQRRRMVYWSCWLTSLHFIGQQQGIYRNKLAWLSGEWSVLMIHGFHCTFGPLQAVLSTVDLASRRLAQQTERFSDSVSVPPLCLKWDKTVIFTQTDRLFTQAVLNYSFTVVYCWLNVCGVLQYIIVLIQTDTRRSNHVRKLCTFRNIFWWMNLSIRNNSHQLAATWHIKVYS